MFSKMSVITALILMLAGAAVARAADDVGTDAPTKRGSMVGVVVRLDDTNLIMKTKSGIEAKVATNDQTEVTIDGKPGALADLKAGTFVQVLSTNDTAYKIVASTHKPKLAK